MSRSDVKLLNSLVDYVLDVKPYHTKLREFLSELFFEDRLNANFQENLQWNIHQQNIWTRDDVGGYLLNRTSEGLDSDRIFKIPATIYPRFSLDDGMLVDQTPPGDDTASQDRTDSDNDGLPDGDYPWPGVPGSSSHMRGSDSVYVLAETNQTGFLLGGGILNSGTYYYNYDLEIVLDSSQATLLGFGPGIYVSFDDFGAWPGSYNQVGDVITVLGIAAAFVPSPEDIASMAEIGIDPSNVNAFCAFDLHRRNGPDAFDKSGSIKIFYTESGRYRVPFHTGSRVRVNNVEQVFNEDYIVDGTFGFIQFLPGKYPSPGDYIDINLFKTDRLFISYLYPFDYSPTADFFTITIDDSYPTGHSPTIFTSVSANPKAALTIDDASGATTGDIWQVTAVGYWKFSVQKIFPTVGPTEFAYFKQPFDNGEIAFTVDRVWSDYYLTNDLNSYPSYDLNVFGFSTYSGTLEPTNFFPNLNLRTEHGVVTDPSPPDYAPVSISPYGKVKKLVEETSLGNLEYYVFELDEAPPRGAYIELRIEQNNQFNPRLHTSIIDEVRFTDLINFQEGLCTNTQTLSGQYASNINDPPPQVLTPGSEPYPPVETVAWAIVPIWPTYVYDLPLFDPVCILSERIGYDDFLYDELTYDYNSYYACIIDDFYLTIEFTSPPSTKIIHNVELHPQANFYQEPQIVNEIVLYHGRAIIPTAVTVYYMGSIIIPDNLVIDGQRVVVTFNTAKSFAVLMAF